MRRLPLALVLALTLPAPLFAGKKSDARIAELEARVAELEARVEAMAQERDAEEPDAAMSNADAMALMERAMAAQQEGDRASAIALFQRVIDGQPRNGAAGLAERELKKLEVLGKSVRDLGVDDWIQGEGALSEEAATLLVFWEVWCPHCRRELPKLQATADTWGPRGLRILGLTRLSRGKTKDDVLAFVGEHGIAFPIGHESGALSTSLAVSGVPAAAMVIGGEVVWRGHPAELDDDLFEAWLAD
jgi:thiol-disulfide isomerase/thioredoxin